MSTTPITSEEVELALARIDRPEFKQWARHAFNQGVLELPVMGVIKKGVASTVTDAIVYLSEHSNGNGNHKVTIVDFSKTMTNPKAYHELKEVILGEEKKSGKSDPTRWYGTIGHSAIPAFLAGELRNIEAHVPSQPKQMDFFEEMALQKYKVSTKGPRKSHARLIQEINEVEEIWTILAREMKHGLLLRSKLYQTLQKKMISIFGYYAIRVIEHGGSREEDYVFLTLMAWARITIWYRDLGANMVMLREISMLPHQSRIGFGRLDALSVEKIKNQEVQREDLEHTRKVMKKIKYATPYAPCVGDVIKGLISGLGVDLGLVITDWKFLVGDGPKVAKEEKNIIKAEQVINEPLPHHAEQMDRYLSSALISHAFSSERQIEDIEKIWEEKRFTVSGRIIYFFADRAPIVHTIRKTTEEIKKAFQIQIATNYSNAQYRSGIRHINNAVFTHVLKLVTEEKPHDSSQNETLHQGTLDGMPTPYDRFHHKTIDEIMQKMQVPRFHADDPYEIIQITGKKKGRDTHSMRLNRFMEMVDEGKLSYEIKGNGDLVARCWLHRDDTPSYHISLEKKIFKCFSCGIGGEFLQGSIPEHLEAMLASSNNQRLANRRKLIDMTIDPKLYLIMETAQYFLQSRFLNSKAEIYLTVKRGLRADLAYGLGVGYGSVELITDLFAAGFTYDDLLHYGFIGVSTNVSRRGRVVEFLQQRHGMSVDDQIRMIEKPNLKTGKKDILPGLPYFILDECLTYPLEIKGRITGFYGRSIDPHCPKKHAHKKLIDKIGLPHGAFNMTNAMRSHDLFVEEAPINANTLIQISDTPGVTAIIGSNNWFLLDELLTHTGDLIIGLNNDPSKIDDKGVERGMTGQRSTSKIIKHCVENNFKGKIFEFTSGFAAAHANIPYNDPNQLWMDYGPSYKWSFNKYIEVHKYTKRVY